MKSKFFVFTTSVLILSGCTSTPLPPAQLSRPSAEEKLIFKEIITSKAFDPESVRFKEPMAIINNEVACVEINAKNRFGGYTGFKAANLVKYDHSGWTYVRMEPSLLSCVRRAGWRPPK
jgi:hypothetical protein